MREALTGLALFVLMIYSILIAVICAYDSRFNTLEEQILQCNCSINYGGHNMSIEDALERAGEGLTVDQADEVQILIEEYCE